VSWRLSGASLAYAAAARSPGRLKHCQCVVYKTSRISDVSYTLCGMALQGLVPSPGDAGHRSVHCHLLQQLNNRRCCICTCMQHDKAPMSQQAPRKCRNVPANSTMSGFAMRHQVPCCRVTTCCCCFICAGTAAGAARRLTGRLTSTPARRWQHNGSSRPSSNSLVAEVGWLNGVWFCRSCGKVDLQGFSCVLRSWPQQRWCCCVVLHVVVQKWPDSV
jgi:hypothetical protein